MRMTRRGQDNGKVNGTRTSLDISVASKREVELSVYDKVLDETRIFRCDLKLLESSMAYFSPIIRRYLEEEAEEEEKKKKISRLNNNNNGDIDIKEEDAATTSTNTIAASTTSNSSSKFVNSNTVDIPVELGVNLKKKRLICPPPVPLRVNCDINIFSWLMSYIEGKQRPFTPENAVSIALSSNFLLMTELVDLPLQYIKDHLVEVMLTGVNMECLTGELLARLSSILTEGDVAQAFLKLFEWRAEDSSNRRFLTALLRHIVCDRFGQGRTNSLSWCRYCGVLFDYQQLKRLERSDNNVKPVECPRLTKNSIGTHGELLTTHTPSQYPVDLAFPSISWSDEHVERWAWRVIGATYIFQCRRCQHHVLLIDTIHHSCRGGVGNFINNFINTDISSESEAEALLAWYEIAKELYPGGLPPMYSHQSDVPRECVLGLTSAGDWSGGEPQYNNNNNNNNNVNNYINEYEGRGVPGLWRTHPIAVERAVDGRGRVSLDSLNGFERWLVVELQQMMEEFSEAPRPTYNNNNNVIIPVARLNSLRGGRGMEAGGRRREASSGAGPRVRTASGARNSFDNNNNNNFYYYNNNNRSWGAVAPSLLLQQQQQQNLSRVQVGKLSAQNMLSVNSTTGKRNSGVSHNPR